MPEPYAFVETLSSSTRFKYCIVIRQDGSLMTWGQDNFAGYSVISDTPVGNNFVQISCGRAHCTALRQNGSLVSWGSNNHDQISNTPAGNNFVQVSCGNDFSVALKKDGSLVSWGYDYKKIVSNTPAGNNFAYVSCGYNSCTAIKKDGSLVSWGDDNSGQVSKTPTGNDFVQVSCGTSSATALRQNGSLISWGYNDVGQVSKTPKGNNFVQVSCGKEHCTALKSDGSLVSWGSNNYGQVSKTPTGNNFVQVTCGFRHSIAIKKDCSLVGWGENEHGLLSNIPTGNNFCAPSLVLPEEPPKQYTIKISANPPHNSWAFLSGGGVTNAGETITVSTMPASGYDFSHWSEDGIAVSNNPSYSFVVDRDRNLVANFAKQIIRHSVTLNASPAEGGITNGSGTYDSGTKVTVTATSNPGYSFLNWTENGITVSSNSDYSFSITRDVVLTANFVALYTVSLSSNPVDGGSVAGAGTYQNNTAVTINATPNPGYNFLNWTEDGVVVSNNQSYTFNITNNRNLVANFAQQIPKYEVILYPVPVEGGSVNGAGIYDKDTSITITATSSEGYDFSHWSEGQSYISNEPTYTFTVTRDRILTANFVQQIEQYLIETESAPFDGGATSGAGTYYQDTSVTVEAFSAPGHVFLNWTESGTVVSTNKLYTFAATADRHLIANFAAIHEISLSAYPPEGGNVSGAGSYHNNTSVTIDANPLYGYTFVNWTENGEEVSTSPKYSFIVQKSRHLVAIFKKASYLNVHIEGVGDTSPAVGQHIIEPEKEITFTALPSNDDWTFKHWIHPDTGDIITESSFNWVPGNQPQYHAVAVFEKIKQYTVSLFQSPTGSADLTGAGTYPQDSVVTIEALPLVGYKFLEWTSGGVRTSDSPKHEFVLTEDINIVAHFISQEIYISANPSPSHAGIVTGGGSYFHEDTVTLTATPNQNYRFKYWEEDGAPVSYSRIFSFKAYRSRRLIAVFQDEFYEDSVALGKPPVIWYNIPYRGPFEYDKFVLNYLQLNNAVLFLQGNIGKSQLSLPNNLSELQKQLDQLYSVIQDNELSTLLHHKKIAIRK